MGVTIDDARAIATTLPHSYEALVRGRMELQAGRIVDAACSRAETIDSTRQATGPAGHSMRRRRTTEARAFAERVTGSMPIASLEVTAEAGS
jgi:hypothetical protein